MLLEEVLPFLRKGRRARLIDSKEPRWMLLGDFVDLYIGSMLDRNFELEPLPEPTVTITRAQLGLEIKPCRELDAIIAEKVMGWRWNEQTAWSPTGSRNSRTDLPDDSWWWLPYYSADIAAAWEVMEMPHFDAWFIGRNASGAWEVLNPWTDNTVVSTADTAPHAICLAALKALRLENK